MAHIAIHAPSPVVVVPADWRPRPARQGKVVVGVDGSAESWNAIAFAFGFAAQTDASVTAVLAWNDPRSTGPGDMLFPVHDLDSLEEARAADLSEAVAGQVVDHPDVKVVERLVHGAAAKVLEAESRDADLLVVGSRGRGRIRGFPARLGQPRRSPPRDLPGGCGPLTQPSAPPGTGRSALLNRLPAIDGGDMRGARS